MKGRKNMAQLHEPQQTIVAWLNDAYAMEQSLVSTLEGHAKDAKEFPQVQSVIERHVEATKQHANMVQQCIERLGGDTSTIKAGMAKMMGTVQGAGSNLLGAKEQDTLVKNALTEDASEHFEIASYTALMTAARTIGDMETAQICQTILQDEQGMAQWLEQNLPMLVQETVAKNATAGMR
jgi:ferritin-like metal-binding protein YciE